MDPPFRERLLQPGRNCWRLAHADRVGVLIDGEAYFRAVRDAIARARHSFIVLGWDIDSRMRLVPDGADDGLPEPLGDFLNAVVARRPGLRGYVLSWDFAMLYALEREWLPVYKLGGRTHRRLSFHLDGRHPVGASHHQKVVVIDDAVAFVGGFDLTRSRWDTSRHAPDDPLRRDADGKPYGPFHDVQALVDGEAARALGELARERWRRATGRRIVPATARRTARTSEGHDAPADPWPPRFVPDLTDVLVGLSRTEPAFEGRPAVTEVRELHVDAIASARRRLFLESQYFSSSVVGEAMRARLAEPDGPDVVLVSSQSQSGWLEQATMGALRARLHHRLHQADAHGRYRFYCPHVPGPKPACLNVHSKLMIVDDALLCIGSANLSNRSMTLDTECGIAVEACGEARVAASIARVRHRLLAEHLGTTVETVASEEARRPRLIDAIEALQRPGRTLERFEPDETPGIDAWLSVQAVADPERPIEPDRLVEQLVPTELGRPLAGQLAVIGAAIAALVLLAVAWRFTPLGQYLNLDTLVQTAQRMDEAPFTPLIVIAAYVLAGLLVLPVTLLIAVTGIVFDPLVATAYALAGTLSSAAVTYALGHALGRDTVRRLAGAHVNRLSQRIARRGVLAMILVRLLPVAPFTLVNLVIGASHVRLRDFLLGTVLGMAPGIAMTTLFAHHLIGAIRAPSASTVGVVGAVLAVLVGSTLAARRWLGRGDRPVGRDDRA